MTLVSVIIPCYNYGRFLTETLGSILEQTYENWECIVVDDGSTDNTRDVVASFIKRDSRFKYIYQKNKGLPAARNTGIESATGEFIQFLDADDLIEKRKLEAQAGYLSSHPGVDIVYGEARYFSTEKPLERLYSLSGSKKTWMPKVSGTGKDILKHLVNENIMPVSSPLIKRKVIDICGSFDETLRAHEDWEYWIRCALHNLYFFYSESPEALTLIRYHSSSMTSNRERMFSSIMIIREKISAHLKDKDIYFSNKRHYANMGITLALERMRTGRRMYGTGCLIKYLLVYCLYLIEKLFAVSKREQELRMRNDL